MAHHNTVFAQLLRLLPRHEFEAEAREYQHGQELRVMSRWAQFVALGFAQLTGRQSLRDIVSNLSAQGRKLYHLGVTAAVSRSSLARVNAEQPHTLYEALFGRLLSACQQRAPRHRGTAFDSRTSYTPLTRPRSTYVSRSSPGRRFGGQRPRSSCTLGWTWRAIS